MSFELAVWHGAGPVRPEEAAEVARHIDHDWVFVRRRPGFDEFWRELLEVYPDDLRGNRPPADLDAPPEHLLRTPEEVLRSASSATAIGFISEPSDRPSAPSLGHRHRNHLGPPSCSRSAATKRR